LSRRQELADWLHFARERLAAHGCKVPAVEARTRYGWVRQVLEGVASRPAARAHTFSDRLDRVLTHHIAGFVVFVILMLVVFQAIYRGATPLMEACEGAQNRVGAAVGSLLAPGPLRSLLVDGIIGGVGAVLVFLPQIVILFLFIALLEDCGYMARAAFLMDKLMTRVGLSGRSFVPLMSSFACAVPGIMATRVIENRRDRLTTILVAPLMSCSARQPVYALLIGAFIPATYYAWGWIGLRELALFAMTSLGAVVAIPVAWLLKKTAFRGETPPFVMELPSYKWPSPRLVLNRVYDRARAFVVRAGTLIFATNVLIWAAGYYPGDHTTIDRLQFEIDRDRETLAEPLERREELTKQVQELALELAAVSNSERQRELETRQREYLAELDRLSPELAGLDDRQRQVNRQRGALLEHSLLGRIGRAIEPVVAPLGWDWRIGVGVIASFPAREVIIGTLGTIYSLGGEDESGLAAELQAARWPDGRPVYTVAVALSIMVFFALCAQCASTLMVIQRETNDWRWALFTFVYMTLLAYLGALVTYQVARWFSQ
ncbi:MAG: ferrous iron transport protein B, partial [Planctomycetaceae bacterium]